MCSVFFLCSDAVLASPPAEIQEESGLSAAHLFGPTSTSEGQVRATRSRARPSPSPFDRMRNSCLHSVCSGTSTECCSRPLSARKLCFDRSRDRSASLLWGQAGHARQV